VIHQADIDRVRRQESRRYNQLWWFIFAASFGTVVAISLIWGGKR
jgi:hypothetical protein